MKHKELCNRQQRMPLNLQFFAEESTSGEDTTNSENTESENNEGKKEEKETPPSKTYEDALAEIAAAQAEVKKAKAERDAALKKSGEATKALRAKMTESELEAEKIAQEKEEHEAYVKDLELFKKKTEAKERYISQFGRVLKDDVKLVAELAEKAADAETKGDAETLQDVNDQWVQAIRKMDKAEAMGNRGRVNFGDGDDSTPMTKEEIMAIPDQQERIKAIARNQNAFK